MEQERASFFLESIHSLRGGSGVFLPKMCRKGTLLNKEKRPGEGAAIGAGRSGDPKKSQR